MYTYDSQIGEKVVSAAFFGQPGKFGRFWIPVNPVLLALLITVTGSFSDNFYNSGGKYCNCVPLIL